MSRRKGYGWLICFAIFLFVGAGLGVTALALTDFDYRKALNFETFEEKEFSAPVSDVREISVTCEDMRVVVQPAAGAEVRVRYGVNERVQAQVSLAEGVLTVNYVYGGQDKWYDFLKRGFFESLGSVGQCVRVEVPAAFAGKIALAGDNASLSLSGISAGEVKISCRNGAIGIDTLTAQTLTVTNDNGSVGIEHTKVAGVLRAGNRNGSISLEETSASAIAATNDNGSIDMDDVTAQEVTAANRNGRITADDLTAERFVAENDNDTIAGEGLRCPDLTAKNRNGKIRLTISGRAADYAVECTVTNGSSNIGSKLDGTKRLILHNDNGSVRVYFA